MGVINNIQNALNSKLNSIGGIPTIYYPNVTKEPTQGAPYIRPTLIPASTEQYTLSEGHYYSGIYQVDIFTKLNKGTAEALLIADIIRTNFDRQSLITNGDIVHIQAISYSQAERIESWWRVFLEINYMCVA